MLLQRVHQGEGDSGGHGSSCGAEDAAAASALASRTAAALQGSARAGPLAPC